MGTRCLSTSEITRSAAASRRVTPAFGKAVTATPKGRPKGSKNFATSLNEALDEKVYVTEDGRRCRITKRELVVSRSSAADLRAIKQLTAIVERVDQRAGASPATPPIPVFSASERRSLPRSKANGTGYQGRDRSREGRRSTLRVSWTALSTARRLLMPACARPSAGRRHRARGPRWERAWRSSRRRPPRSESGARHPAG